MPIPIRSLALAAALAAGFVAAPPAPAQDSPQGQDSAPETIDPVVRTSGNAARERPLIDAFVRGQAQALREAQDPAAAAAVRRRLIEQVSGDFSTSFADEYGRALVEQVRPVLAEQGPFVRLNTAIAVREVAARTGTPRLVPLAQALIEDEFTGVSLWGIKSAEALLPESVRQNAAGREPLIGTIVAAVERNPQAGPIADEAYHALLLRVDDVGQRRPDEFVLERAADQLAQAVQAIMARRTAQYGPPADPLLADDPERASPLPTTPPIPLAERQAVILLTDPQVWPKQGAPAQRATLTAFRDLTLRLETAVAAANAAANAAEDDSETQEAASQLRKDLTDLLKRLASAFSYVASGEGGPDVDALRAAADDLANQPPTLPDEVLREKVGALLTAVQAVYPDLPPPPQATGQPPADDADGGTTAGEG